MPADVSEVEGRIPYQFGQDAVEVPGARALLDQLEQAGAPWMIGEIEAFPFLNTLIADLSSHKRHSSLGHWLARCDENGRTKDARSR